MKHTMKHLLTVVAIASTVIAVDANDRFYIQDFEIAPGETKSVNIMLDNDTAYVGFQSDIYLPEGFTLSDWAVTDRKADHSISYHTQTDGAVRMVVVSLTNSYIQGNSGAMISFNVTASADLAVGDTYSAHVTNTIFGEKDATSHFLAEESATITIITPSTPTPKPEPNKFYIKDFEIEAGVSDYRLALILDNETQFTGFTADLILSVGITTDNYMEGNSSRNNRHTYIAETQEDGVVKLSATSSRVFNEYEGELAYIYLFTTSDFSGTHGIELKNIVFTDASGATYNLPDATCTVTGPTVEDNKVELVIQDSFYNTITLYTEKGSTHKFKFTPLHTQYILNAVVYNGNDVTDELADGVFTTPELTEDATLNISYEIPTGEQQIQKAGRVRAYGCNNKVIIHGCKQGECITLYDTDGILLQTLYATSDTTSISMPGDAIYIVQVGNQAIKVAI